MKYFVDGQGRYLGSWDANPPVGVIEVPFPPADARQIWTGAGWGALGITPKRIAARRYEAEVGGITLNGVRVDTDDRSKLLINGAALEATIDPTYVTQWKTPAGFIELTAPQVIGIARAVRAHVQACFDREAVLLQALQEGALTDEMLDQGWPESQ